LTGFVSLTGTEFGSWCLL